MIIKTILVKKSANILLLRCITDILIQINYFESISLLDFKLYKWRLLSLSELTPY